jgi:hypothetical protein
MFPAIFIVGVVALLALSARANAAQADRNLQVATDNERVARENLRLLQEQGVPATPAAQTRVLSGPPGLILRREPEIRALNTQALTDYVRLIRDFGLTNLPVEWRDSMNDASGELGVRSMLGKNLSGFTTAALANALRWLDKLVRIGMPLQPSEQTLALNLREETSYRTEAA